ncbi:MAG: asparagine synthase-related protein [Elusimicrobia bacterium]|nr:asparagine synthase-related protein [Elusimicrobiota bacterium]
MSAIFGVINWNDQPVSANDLERMRAALAAHGADGGGIWNRGSAGLGQQLMCFTPEDRFERQPLAGADGQRVLVSDGRLDNRPELMRELGGAPLDTREAPDSDFILRAYNKWGEDCMRHLIGVFAFAVWDARAQTLFLARSPIVAPQLLYWAAPSRLAFATTVRALCALPFVPRALNEEKLADFLVDLGGKPRTTLYRDIYRLPTGHLLAAGRNGFKTRCFWQPDLQREIRFPRDTDYLAAFDELFTRVVRDNMRSSAPVGAMMSGGLDSSSLAVTAARLLRPQGKRLATFTEVPRAGFDGPVPAGRYADETPLVQAIARTYDNLDLNPVHTDGRTFLDDLDRLFFNLEGPFRNTANRVWIEAILQAARQRGIGVILDGMQGNLTVSWEGSGLLPELLRGGRWARALREAQASARQNANRSSLRILVGQGVMPLLPAPLRLAINWLRGKPENRITQHWRDFSSIHPDFAAAYKVDARAREQRYDFRIRSMPASRQIRYDALVAQDLGAFITAFRAMFGVDSRSPLADVRLAEFCLALPEDQFLRDGEPRSLIRRAMAGRLPPEVLSNRKRGLQAADWFEELSGVRAELPAELDRLEKCGLAHRALDLPRLRRLVEYWPKGGYDQVQVTREYSCILERGLMAGRFLRWFEEQG